MCTQVIIGKIRLEKKVASPNNNMSRNRRDVSKKLSYTNLLVYRRIWVAKLEICRDKSAARITFATYHGSIAFEKGREAALQHLLYAVAEMMKQLFWSGDLNAMTFPPELDVCRIL